MSQYFVGNSDVKCDPIWVIAGRNNEKPLKVTYRIKGERVTKSEFDKFKEGK